MDAGTWVALIVAVGGVVGSYFNHRANIRKLKADAAAQQSEIDTRIDSNYQKAVDFLDVRLDKHRQTITELEGLAGVLKAELEKARDEIQELKVARARHKRQIEKLGTIADLLADHNHELFKEINHTMARHLDTGPIDTSPLIEAFEKKRQGVLNDD
jgi:chromosome segregation ATPase